MLRLSKNSYLDSTHKLLMIPHMNVEIFDDSAHKFWRMIAWWKQCHPYTLLLAYIKNKKNLFSKDTQDTLGNNDHVFKFLTP